MAFNLMFNYSLLRLLPNKFFLNKLLGREINLIKKLVYHVLTILGNAVNFFTLPLCDTFSVDWVGRLLRRLFVS